MLYAGSSWSELPISVLKEEYSGEDNLYNLIIDEILSTDLYIQEIERINANITQESSTDLHIQEMEVADGNITQELGFDLIIDQQLDE